MIDSDPRSMLHSRLRKRRASCSRGECSRHLTVMLRFSGQLEREDFVIPEEAQLWRERYRLLFEKNVAGALLTTPEGRMRYFNEVCARIFGFSSSEEIPPPSAWEFYFHRAERDTVLRQL